MQQKHEGVEVYEHEEVPTHEFCEYCGSEILSDSIACSSCGAKRRKK